MKYLLLLLLLLAASAVGAVQNEAPQQIYWVQRGLTAHVVGAERPQGVQGDDILVFDSFTGATTYTSTTGTPRTYMGMPIGLDDAAGSNPTISKMVVYLAYNGTTTQVFNSLRVRVQLWNTWSDTGSPVFSNAAGSVIEANVAGPITLNANTYAPIAVTLASPVPLSGLTAHGIAFNFQGDTGSGLASADTLTPLLRHGTNPVAVGTNLLPTGYGYRNASTRTDFNFLPTDSRSFTDATQQAVVVQLYASGGTLISQNITNFAANPASPVLADGSFTVSATGGASGNPVIFSIAPASAAVCTAGGTNGATVSILAAGTCTVLAVQAGNATYSSAPQQSLPVSIGNGAALIQDGGFEAGFVPTYWAQSSINFGTPLCNAGCGGAGPRTGTYWVWFGGAGTAAEAGSVQQTGVIAAGSNTLNFHVWWESSVASPPDPAAVFNVKVDGNTIFTLTPATASAYSTAYTRASANISAYADGNSHTVRFESNNAAAASSTNILLDDISIGGDRIFANGFEQSGMQGLPPAR